MQDISATKKKANIISSTNYTDSQPNIKNVIMQVRL